MSSFILIPGAGGVAWYWNRVVPLLVNAGHVAVAVDLPGDDPKRATFAGYADRVVAAIGERRDVILVAQSLGGFTAPLVCTRASVSQLVFVNAMIPVPHETCGDWGTHTGSSEARKAAARVGGYSEQFDDATYFLHDVPPPVIAVNSAHERPQAEEIFADRCAFERWPEIPIHVFAGRDDRLFPLAFQRRVARERLGLDVEEIAGGHLIALSNPIGLAAGLMACCAA